MKILSISLKNFASYEELRFDFNDPGLTAISGPTGSGKSTLCDAIPWILFGVTSKNGKVDDVKSWSNQDGTAGRLFLELNNKKYSIYRRRGPGIDKDLTFAVNDTPESFALNIRGKDLIDTQDQINQLLGMTAETYLAGAYFHEFSQTAQFFNTTAKNRRLITEQLVDLSLPNLLQKNLSKQSKDTKQIIEKLESSITNKIEFHSYLIKHLGSVVNNIESWDQKQKLLMADTENKSKNFEADKLDTIKLLTTKQTSTRIDKKHNIESINREIKELTHQIRDLDKLTLLQTEVEKSIEEMKQDKCTECSAPKRMHETMVATKNLYDLKQEQSKSTQAQLRIDGLENRLKKIKEQTDPYSLIIEQEKARKSTYLEQLENLKYEINPFLEQEKNTIQQVADSELKLKEEETRLQALKVEQSDLELLLEVTETLRNTIISNAIGYLEKSTNSLIEEYFAGELRIKLSASESDKLEVNITKDGNQASFSQLSKGQRQLLKLAFGVSVMSAVSNYSGVNFNCVWFDEALDGMDDNTKIMAFDLLNSLTNKYESIFVVDHSETFKSLFSNKYEVQLINGSSRVEKT